ncbi:MAG: class I SAM-dependent methyltransferase [Thermoanaerobaculia bacterium]
MFIKRLLAPAARRFAALADPSGAHARWVHPAFGPLTTGMDSSDGVRRVIPPRDADVIIARDGLPLPPQRLWRGYGTTEERYLELANLHTSSMLSILREAGFSMEEGGKRVLDFGCAAGPMLRTLHQYAEHSEIWGVDIDSDCIDWCRRHLPAFRFATNTTAPHLPFEDRSFDLIYCGSVFSHIVEMADSWLLELARILRPGGLLYASIHDKQFIGNTIRHAPTWEFSKEVERQTPPGEFAVFALGSGPHANVFYDRAYFMRLAAPVFDLVSANDRAYGNQSAMLMRRRG